MTGKERIMIDTNEYFLEVIDDGGGTIGYTVVHPEGLLRDIIKQNKKLARKTQECEELKAQLNDMACMDDDNVLCYPRQELKKECERYKQALEEIEKVCLEDTRTFADGTQVRYDSLDEILNIITKVKGKQ